MSFPNLLSFNPLNNPSLRNGDVPIQMGIFHAIAFLISIVLLIFGRIKETKEKIMEIVKNPLADAYSFPLKNFFHKKWIKHCGWWPNRKVRLFRKSKGIVNNALVHESLEVNGNIMNLNTPIIHKSIRDLSSIIDKINIYSSAGAESLFRQGKNASGATAFVKGVAAFFKLYILRLGILDGHEGFVISFSHAVNTCYKYLKLKERYKK